MTKFDKLLKGLQDLYNTLQGVQLGLSMCGFNSSNPSSTVQVIDYILSSIQELIDSVSEDANAIDNVKNTEIPVVAETGKSSIEDNSEKLNQIHDTMIDMLDLTTQASKGFVIPPEVVQNLQQNNIK